MLAEAKARAAAAGFPQSRAVARASKAKARVKRAEGGVAAAKAKLAAIQARNEAWRAAGSPSTIETGPKGGRFYTSASGEKIYVK